VSETKPTDQRLMQVGKALKQLRREEVGISLEDAADHASVSAMRLTHIEDGMDPSLSELFRLAEAYGFTPNGLIARVLPSQSGS
jgi:transcriptional regulator with XRE-family HTH domain